MAYMVAYLGFTETTQVRLPLGRRLFGQRCGLLSSDFDLLFYWPYSLPAPNQQSQSIEGLKTEFKVKV